MVFGKEDTVALIKTVVSQSSTDAYDPLDKILRKDISGLLFAHYPGLPPADREDITQDAIVKVWMNLPRFCFDVDARTEGERNGWLSKLVLNQCTDYFRKQNRMHENEVVEYDDAIGCPDGQSIEKNIANRDALFHALECAFSIHTSPEALIAFTYNRLLGTLSSKNGSPRSIAEEFEGRPMRELCDLLEDDLSEVLNCRIPAQVMRPLLTKIAQDPLSPFTLSERAISDKSSWIAKKVKEQYNNEQ